MLVAMRPGLFFGKKCEPGDALPDRERWDAAALHSNINQGMVKEVFDTEEILEDDFSGGAVAKPKKRAKAGKK